MFKVLSPGIWSAFQDQGRFGFRHLGVPVCGSLDEYSANKANFLAGNPLGSTVIECTIRGPVMACIYPAEVVISGVGFNPTINQIPACADKLYKLRCGDVLDVGSSKTGMRSYIAAKGGFNTEKILGSSSYDSIIAPTMKLVKDLIIETCQFKSEKSIEAHQLGDEINFDLQTISVIPGSEFNLLKAFEIKELLNHPWTIDPSSSRMAILLKENFVVDKAQIISAAVYPGCVQLTPSGKLILLMKDAQTTGGYARILQISPTGMNILSQKVPGSQIFFKMEKK